ncbi:hypothetical protein B0H63DRAFT_222162 [Podospora didyma]|uniref:Uncharacterized protein n=1 Tax=Podospora didyma TaxID=330526 RepID=A0AAE0KKP9_9PEZI|nr:hypothetical protein B0H63DRAFT_222162 [Podospora didyma]
MPRCLVRSVTATAAHDHTKAEASCARQIRCMEVLHPQFSKPLLEMTPRLPRNLPKRACGSKAKSSCRPFAIALPGHIGHKMVRLKRENLKPRLVGKTGADAGGGAEPGGDGTAAYFLVYSWGYRPATPSPVMFVILMSSLFLMRVSSMHELGGLRSPHSLGSVQSGVNSTPHLQIHDRSGVGKAGCTCFWQKWLVASGLPASRGFSSKLRDVLGSTGHC